MGIQEHTQLTSAQFHIQNTLLPYAAQLLRLRFVQLPCLRLDI